MAASCFRDLVIFFGSNFDLCLLRRVSFAKKKLMKLRQRVAVLVSYNQLTEKIVGKIEGLTPRHRRARP